MLFAKVALGLPLHTTFDYLIPQRLEKKVTAGVRVWVPFHNRKLIGYIVGLSGKTNIEKVKPIYGIIDETPILGKNILELTRQLGNYYLCSWGEAIETALPDFLRKGKPVKIESALSADKALSSIPIKTVLLHNLNKDGAWDFYLQEIKNYLDGDKGIIFLSPQIQSAIAAQRIIKNKFNQESALLHSRQSNKEGLSQWLKIKNNQAKIVVGTRLAVFAPLKNPGLIIVDNESDSSFKQDQTPHYHARDVALMRSKIDKSNVILGALSPSLEALQLTRKKKVEYIFVEKKVFPEVRTIDTKMLGGYKKQRAPLSYQLQAQISQALQTKEKILVFLNRRGFATFASCPNCHKVLRCPRCDINLSYHFKENILNCHYCNYKMTPPNLCPDCNSSYIRYLGIGTEKIESELSRLYPAARIARAEKTEPQLDKFDILVSSKPLLQEKGGGFDLIAVASIDNSLNRVDFRAAEKTFALLIELLALTDKKLIIQTNIPQHYCFGALENKDINSFYEEELKFRKQLRLPPFTHMILIKLRGKNSDNVKNKSALLLEKLNAANKGKQIKITPVSLGPEKLRDNFYSQILIKSTNLQKSLHFLNKHIQNFRHSDIIVTVDVDPI